MLNWILRNLEKPFNCVQKNKQTKKQNQIPPQKTPKNKTNTKQQINKQQKNKQKQNSLCSFKNVIFKMCTEIIYLIYVWIIFGIKFSPMVDMP